MSVESIGLGCLSNFFNLRARTTHVHIWSVLCSCFFPPSCWVALSRVGGFLYFLIHGLVVCLARSIVYFENGMVVCCYWLFRLFLVPSCMAAA